MSGISDAVTRSAFKGWSAFKADRALDQLTMGAIPMASLGIMPPTGAAMDCTHGEGALGRCLIAGEVAGWFRRAAMQGHADSQFNLGDMFENGRGVTHDRAEALRWYRMAAAQGHAGAAKAIGQFGA